MSQSDAKNIAPIPEPAQLTLRPLLKRVLRHGKSFMCGCCRTTYMSNDQASLCLVRCLQNQARYSPSIMSFHTHGVERFRCRFCMRDYGVPERAEKCAVECRSKLIELANSLAARMHDAVALKKAPLVALVSDVGPTPVVIEPKPVKLPEAIPAKVIEKRLDVTPPVAPIAEPQLPVEASPEVKQPTAASPEEAPTAPVKNYKPKASFKDKFFRDGARYCCSVCQEKYFTKAEVERCFESHP